MVRVGLELTASKINNWRSNNKRPKKIPLEPLGIEPMAKSTHDRRQRSRSPKGETMVRVGIELATGTVEGTHSPTKRDPESIEISPLSKLNGGSSNWSPSMSEV
jgi:hypothetical protein